MGGALEQTTELKVREGNVPQSVLDDLGDQAMNIFKRGLPKNLMRGFVSDIGASEFFTYVGNTVTIEKALASIALLSPDFVEKDGCIFWSANADEYDPRKYPMHGLKKDARGQYVTSQERADIERYRNNFSVSQFFSRWEDSPERSVFCVDLSKEDYELCHAFATRIAKHWNVELLECFPEKRFLFEVTDNLLDEYGVCITFWQA